MDQPASSTKIIPQLILQEKGGGKGGGGGGGGESSAIKLVLPDCRTQQK